MLTTIETALEAIEKKPAIAFVNNAVSFTGVALNYKGLIEDLKEVKDNPKALEELEAAAKNKFGKKYENEIVSIVFTRVWVSIIYASGNMIEMAEEIKKYKERDSPKLA